MNMVLVVAAERIVLGGGVAGAPGLLPAIRTRLRDLLGGYVDVPRLADLDRYLVPPALGGQAGVLGAIGLAKAAAAAR